MRQVILTAIGILLISSMAYPQPHAQQITCQVTFPDVFKVGPYGLGTHQWVTVINHERQKLAVTFNALPFWAPCCPHFTVVVPGITAVVQPDRYLDSKVGRLHIQQAHGRANFKLPHTAPQSYTLVITGDGNFDASVSMFDFSYNAHAPAPSVKECR